LIEAFKQLENTAKTPNNFKLVIAANGDEVDDQDYVKYLQTITEKRDNIILFCARKKSTIKQLLSHAYLFVQPAEATLLDGALCEAMKYGLAPLVSDTKENLEFIGKTGFLFKAKSLIDLRDRLAYLLSRKEEVVAMGDNAKGYIQKQLKKNVVVNGKGSSGKITLEKNNIWNLKNLLKK
jgi:glycosyltransferase involved in cell wall biosynthesis